MRDRNVVRRRGYGVCHRCGWRGNVGKVRRRDRKYMLSGRSFGRLCDECVVVLLQGHPSRQHPQKVGSRLTVVKDRDVA